jgi:hypothetical protein
MTLGAGEPFSHPAVVTNEDFFSHAKEVLRRLGDVAKRCFSQMRKWRRQIGTRKSTQASKKDLLPTFQFLQCASNPALIMNMMIAAKRFLVALLAMSALALCAIAGQTNEPCPLPVTSTADSSTSAQSPEHPACMRKVNHNGMQICLPCPAYDAHIRHGDTDAGPCDKPGNETPPGKS